MARQTIASRAGMSLIVGMLGIDLLARSALPFGIAASRTRAGEVGLELRLLMFGALTLLLLVRTRRWRAALPGLAPASLSIIVCLSGVYLAVIGSLSAAIVDRLLGAGLPVAVWTQAGAAIWLATLAGILASSRLEPRSLGLLFLLLAWWVPVLVLPAAETGAAIGQGISRAPWSADGFLPMLVPHLWALGYVCLERAQR